MKKLLFLSLVFHASMFGVDWKSFFGFKSQSIDLQDPLVQAVRKDEYEKFPEQLKPYGIEINAINANGQITYNIDTNESLSSANLEQLAKKLNLGVELQRNDTREKIRSSSFKKFVGYCAATVGIGSFFYLMTRGLDAKYTYNPEAFHELNGIVNNPALPEIGRIGLINGLNVALYNPVSSVAATGFTAYGLTKMIKKAIDNLPGRGILSVEKYRKLNNEIKFQDIITSMKPEDYKKLKENNASESSAQSTKFDSLFLAKFNQNRDLMERKRDAHRLITSGFFRANIILAERKNALESVGDLD